MSFSLESIGIKAGGKYETIYTTMNKAGEMDAAPIGLKCVDDYAVLGRIFEGSKTLENIKETGIFVVNITSDPSVFARSLYGNLEPKEFVKDDDIVYMKNADAYFIALVKSIEDKEIGKDHVNDGAKFSIVNAESIKIIINKPGTKALNRGIFAFLESLVDYSRIDIIDDEKKDEYIKKFKENERLIDVVAEDEVKEAMKDLKERIIEKGVEL
ncbi:MAG: DUF447 family protein [Methanobrevibacter ruminantium]|uniref:DUF447 domain-containing protein n=1 Tax=Methanobrevibacter ruminantium TaxID=83816 RepID=UPI0026F25230|nr:DUF447 domain-containing protein [Methanobrevibacter ruminantium]MCI5736889.1 DUF447 family protein [Methanobrevibacter ruminantium]MDD6049238.1 DUF447 family protein [Methanobrevibacter ruminantium]MDO5842841.1 DUF447 family protein [Methanobrevibacter ruminantium]